MVSEGQSAAAGTAEVQPADQKRSLAEAMEAEYESVDVGQLLALVARYPGWSLVSKRKCLSFPLSTDAGAPIGTSGGVMSFGDTCNHIWWAAGLV